jgi:hypothetical protein
MQPSFQSTNCLRRFIRYRSLIPRLKPGAIFVTPRRGVFFPAAARFYRVAPATPCWREIVSRASFGTKEKTKRRDNV